MSPMPFDSANKCNKFCAHARARARSRAPLSGNRHRNREVENLKKLKEDPITITNTISVSPSLRA